jgi:hypothetical protein
MPKCCQVSGPSRAHETVQCFIFSDRTNAAQATAGMFGTHTSLHTHGQFFQPTAQNKPTTELY